MIIPAYNAAGFIRDAIQSVKNQDYPCETIVVNDGSADETASIAMRMGVDVISLAENRGAAYALNRGILEADSDYICWLSADDMFVRSDKVRIQVEAMEKYQADWSYYEDFLVGSNPSRPIRKSIWTKGIASRSFILAMILFNPVNGSSVMLRKSSIEIYGVFDSRLRNIDADGEMWLRWARHGAKLIILDGVGAFYLQHKAQTSKKRFAMQQGIMMSRIRGLLT